MDQRPQPGLYLYELKSERSSPVLKELLQLSKSVAQGKSSGFTFVHGQSSLIPNLSLWENLQLSTRHDHWDDFVKENSPSVANLIPLIKEPYKKASAATPWECFLISLMKGSLETSPHLLVDIDENVIPAFVLKTVKIVLMKCSYEKTVLLSSTSVSLWLDCAHHLVKKVGYEFRMEKLDSELLRRHWAARTA